MSNSRSTAARRVAVASSLMAAGAAAASTATPDEYAAVAWIAVVFFALVGLTAALVAHPTRAAREIER